ncbi:hypothetical protein [Sulfurimonas sp.]
MKIFLTSVLVFFSLLSLFHTIDESAMLIYRESFDRAVYSFALAKGINAIISVLQSSEISVNFFVGLNVQFGQILDPVNDLVERFSWIMLASSVSLGIQKLLLILGKSLFIKVVIVISAVISIAIIWIKKLNSKLFLKYILKIFALLIILRFGAVFFIYSSELFYNQVYSQEYQNTTTYIKDYKVELEDIKTQKSNIQKINNNQKGLDSYWKNFEIKMEAFSKKVIKLITIFIVLTVFLPLLFLWFFIFLIKLIFNIKFDNDIMLQIFNTRK